MAISRMQFLRGDFSGSKQPLRPPWALDEDRFVAKCERCGRCAEVCPNRIIRTGRGGFPEIDFTTGECLFCAECVTSCKPGALSRSGAGAPWTVKVTLEAQACLAFLGVECRGCLDPCEPRAIRIPFRPGGVGLPIIDRETCTGCGACTRVCPASALSMQPAQV